MFFCALKFTCDNILFSTINDMFDDTHVINSLKKQWRCKSIYENRLSFIFVTSCFEPDQQSNEFDRLHN